MRLARVLRILAIAVGALVVMAVLGLMLWLWRSQLPNEEARKLAELYASRPALPDADNAFLDIYGFSAPSGVEPHAHGERRVSWLRRLHRDPESAGSDPGEKNIRFSKLRSRSTRKIFEACQDARARDCGEAMRAIAPDEPLSLQEALLLERYQVLLGRSGWREEMWHSASDPLPSYVDVLEAQRLTLIRLRPAALRGDTALIRDALQRDLVFWRMVQQSTDGLIGKMISIAAMRHHFTYANLLLREMPPASVMAAVPPVWETPLNDQERSMWRAMAGEFAFSKTSVRSMYEGEGLYSQDEIASDPIERVFGQVRRRVEPPRVLNEVARMYAAVAREFEVPLDRYLQARGAVVAVSHEQAEATQITSYAMRVGSIEGMRRAALLTAQLRSRAVPANEVAAELAKAQLRTPFDARPFGWDAEEQAIAYEGPVKERRELVLLY